MQALYSISGLQTKRPGGQEHKSGTKKIGEAHNKTAWTNDFLGRAFCTKESFCYFLGAVMIKT